MPERNGWVKLYRKITEKGWYSDPDYLSVWIHLLLMANHKDNEWLYKNKIVRIHRGQFITSRKSLSKSTGVEPSKIERILSCFKSEQQIEQQNLFTSRLITIINYDDYQSNEQLDEQQMNSKRTASEQPVNTNKNVKNVRMKRNKDILTPKNKYGDHVQMTEEEYNKLVEKYGESKTKAMIEKLNIFKGANGKSYKSDYLAILNWVVSWVDQNWAKLQSQEEWKYENE